MPTRAEGVLTSTVARRESDQHWFAVRGGQVHSAEGEQVLHPQLRPGPGQLDGHRPRRRVRLLGEPCGRDALDVVCQQPLPVPLVEPIERRAYRLFLIAGQCGGLWVLGYAGVGHPRGQGLSATLPPVVGGDGIAGGRYGVPDKRPTRQLDSGMQQLDERVLDQVLSDGRVGDPDPDHPADDGFDVGDELRAVVAAGPDQGTRFPCLALGHARSPTRPTSGVMPRRSERLTDGELAQPPIFRRLSYGSSSNWPSASSGPTR